MHGTALSPCCVLVGCAATVEARLHARAGRSTPQVDVQPSVTSRAGGDPAGASLVSRVRVEYTSTATDEMICFRCDVTATTPGVLDLVACVTCSSTSSTHVIPLLVAPNAAVQQEMLAALARMAACVEQQRGKQQLAAAGQDAAVLAWGQHYRQLVLDLSTLLSCTVPGEPGSVPQHAAGRLLVGLLEFLAYHACWCTIGWLLGEACRGGLLAHATEAAERRLQQLQPLLGSHSPRTAAAAAAAATALRGLAGDLLPPAGPGSSGSSSPAATSSRRRQQIAAAVAAARRAAAGAQFVQAAPVDNLGSSSGGKGSSSGGESGDDDDSADFISCGSGAGSSPATQHAQQPSNTASSRANTGRCGCWLPCARGQCWQRVLAATAAALLAVVLLLVLLPSAGLLACDQSLHRPPHHQALQVTPQQPFVLAAEPLLLPRSWAPASLACSVRSRVLRPQQAGQAPPHWVFGPLVVVLLVASFMARRVCLVL